MRNGPSSNKKKAIYWKIYTSSHNNALDLSSEAELLFANEKYARAYMLAYTALQEIAKSQIETAASRLSR